MAQLSGSRRGLGGGELLLSLGFGFYARVSGKRCRGLGLRGNLAQAFGTQRF